MAAMKSNPHRSLLPALLALLLPACGLRADQTSLADLTGQWQGQSRFTGISYQEATQKKVAPQQVEIELHIAADGRVTGRAGGAQLRDCVVEVNRGWLARLLHVKDDFIIRGQLVGVVAAGSANATNTINAPFDLPDGQIKGTLFIIHPIIYPYPFLNLKLSRAP
jgi:hypothetical protein